MPFNFELAENRIRLWQRPGESYEHVLMKALGYAMFVPEFPQLEIEVRVGLRYKPDLVAREADGRFSFWGECGANSLKKTAWLLKHAKVDKLVLFKIETNVAQLVSQIREEIPERYRPAGKLRVINFVSDIVRLTEERETLSVPREWYTEIII